MKILDVIFDYQLGTVNISFDIDKDKLDNKLNILYSLLLLLANLNDASLILLRKLNLDGDEFISTISVDSIQENIEDELNYNLVCIDKKSIKPKKDIDYIVESLYSSCKK